MVRRQGVATFAVAVACAAALVVTGTAALVASPALRSVTGIGSHPSYVSGERIDLPPEWLNSEGPTVVLFARDTCPAVRRALPILQQLAQISSDSGARLILVTGGLNLDAQVAFGAGLGIRGEHIYRFAGPLQVRRIPSIVVLDRSGTIKAIADGTLSADSLAAIERALRPTE